MHIPQSKTVRVTAGVFLLLAVLTIFATEPADAAPSVSWEPASVSEEVLAGDSVTIPVSFTAMKNLGLVEVRVVPELAGVVSVTPSGPFSVSRGEIVELELTLSPGADEAPQALEGTVQVRAAGHPPKNHSRPLPVEISIVLPTLQLSLQTEQISLGIPAGWDSSANSDVAFLYRFPEQEEERLFDRPDISIHLVGHGEDESLEDFLGSYDNGWYAGYQTSGYHTTPSLSFYTLDDRAAFTSSEPELAAFLWLTSSVLVVTASEDTELEFFQILDSTHAY